MAILGTVFSAASAMVEYQQQKEAADEQNRLYRQNQMNAIAAFQDKQVQMNYRATQEQEAAAAQKFDNNLKARAARSTNIVAAGEAGVQGNSVEALQNDIAQREARFNDSVNTNTEWTMADIAQSKKQQGYEALDRINSVRKAQQPSFAGALLKIGSSAVNTMASANKRSLYS
jgi:hypothetical protein